MLPMAATGASARSLAVNGANGAGLQPTKDLVDGLRATIPINAVPKIPKL